jgi:hypothetical protein
MFWREDPDEVDREVRAADRGGLDLWADERRHPRSGAQLL